MKSIDITVNVTAHSEGLLMHKTLRALTACVQAAESQGITIEFNISLDRADRQTLRIAQNFLDSKPIRSAVRLHEVDFGDLADSRNYLIEQSHGKYIAFFDGDDLFSSNYLLEAYQLAEKNDKPAVYSPGTMINFEADHYLISKLDSNSEAFNPVNLFEVNYFISQSFVHSSVYKSVQYKRNGDGYGMEDWLWNTEVTAKGYQFINVPETIFFYRRKKIGGLLSGQVLNKAVLRPSSLFEASRFMLLPTPAPDPIAETVEVARPTGQQVIVGALRRAAKMIKNHPHLHHYAKVQYTLHKNVYNAMIQDMANKRSLQTSQELLMPDMTTISGKIPKRLRDVGINDAMVAEWGKLNQYEPLIRASWDMLEYIPIVEYPKSSRVSRLYYEFCKKNLGKTFKDVILVPHLVRGGADLAAVNLALELAKDNDVLVITTIDVESPWLGLLKDAGNIVSLECKSDFQGISEEWRLILLLRIIQHWGTKRLSIVNSEVGYKLATYYSRALHDVGCAVYLHTYAFDMTEDGYIFNHLPNGLIDASIGVDFYVTDSIAYKEQLQLINGFEDAKVYPLYLPVSSTISQKSDYTKKNKILWASRLHGSKLVEVAVEIGKILKADGIELHMYGTLDEPYSTDNKYFSMIAPHKNIVYHGSYDGFDSIDVNQYDMFLMTSKNEGMPNVILEAAMANIFIIAPAVGGIPESVFDAKNGAVVDNKFDAEAYVTAIRRAYREEYFSNHSVLSKCNKKIVARHSRANYRKSLDELMGVENGNAN